MPAAESEFLLLLADISCYTRFMMTNHTARVHAHGVVSDLIAAVLKEVQLPLEVNKPKGDAMLRHPLRLRQTATPRQAAP